MRPFGTRTATCAPAENSGSSVPVASRSSRRWMPSATASLRVTRSSIVWGSAAVIVSQGCLSAEVGAIRDDRNFVLSWLAQGGLTRGIIHLAPAVTRSTGRDLQPAGAPFPPREHHRHSQGLRRT